MDTAPAGTASAAAGRSAAAALSSRFLSPSGTPSSFSSASVRSGSTSSPTALAAKSSTYVSSAKLRSQVSMSTPVPLLGRDLPDGCSLSRIAVERAMERQERSALSRPIAGKPGRAAFDGGRLTSDAGVLVLAEIERRLKIAERLARCVEDPRSPGSVRHSLIEMIRFRVLLIAAGYPDANDCDALRADPAFKMAVGRLPESGPDLCSQPTMSRLENLPGITALKRMMAAMVELFCDSFAEVPRRIVLDIDDTEERVHGREQLAPLHAPYRGGRAL